MTRERRPYVVSAPDLERDAGGFTVRAYFAPDLAAPETVLVSIYSGAPSAVPLDTSAAPLDVIEARATDALDAFYHPTRHGALNYARELVE